MLKQIIKILLIISVILFTIAIAVSCIFLVTSAYSDFVEWIRSILQKETNWVPYIKSKISIGQYKIIQQSIVLCSIVGLSVVGLLFRHRKKIVEFTNSFLIQVWQTAMRDLTVWKTLSKRESTLFYLIMACCIIRSFWLTYDLPIQYDEAWIYNYFTSNSLPESFLLPSNNHKLYTFIAWWFHLLPGNQTFLVRLPSIITGVVTLLFFFAFTKKYVSTSAALIGLAWFSSCIPVAMYMAHAKSYQLLLLIHLSMLSIYFNIIENGNFNQKKGILLTIIITLGYIANPVFFFGHFFSTAFIIMISIIQRNNERLKNILLFNLMAIPIILPFYLSDLLSGSLSSLLRFAITQKINNSNFFLLCLNNNASFQTGWESIAIAFLVMLILGLAFSYFADRKFKMLIIYASLSILWLPFYALLSKDDTSVHKTIYITISFTIIIIAIFQLLMPFLKHRYWVYFSTSVLIITSNFFLLYSNGWFNWSIPLDRSTKQVSKILLDANASSCYIFHYYYKPAVTFYFKTNHKPIKIFMGVKGSVDYIPEIPTQPTPDFLIIDKEQNSPANISPFYKPVFSDEFVTLYAADTSNLLHKKQ